MSRRRWLYTVGGRPLETPVEVSEDYVPPDSDRAPVFTDRYMEGARATDGTDIGSRQKRRAYMQAHGLADADDYKGVWAKAAEQRAAFYGGRHDTEARREAIARALIQRGKR